MTRLIDTCIAAQVELDRARQIDAQLAVDALLERNRRINDQPSHHDELRAAAWLWVTYAGFCIGVTIFCAAWWSPEFRNFLSAVWGL